MTKTSRYRYPSKKPIRKDRVAMVALVLLAIILVPILIRSGRTPRDDALVVIDDGTISGPIDDGTTDAIGDDSSIDDATVDDGVGPIRSERFLVHTVDDGESIADIATVLGVSVSNLLASNRLFGGEQLQPNQVLYASDQGIVHIIQLGQTLSDIARSYAVPLEALMEANDLTSSSTIFAGDRILIPGATTSFWNNAVALSKGISTQFIWPLEGELVSEFGWRVHPVLGDRHHHEGIDLDVPEGTTVHAAAAGEVYFYGEQPGYGNVLIIEHANGFYSLYGHLSDSFVFAGQYVEMGQAVARSGNTGISSGPHLHFELRNRE
ncbi:M23 family metallopeptidase, partial [Candidatus Bipolaricaulota bacterium]|nr:M23 family metallopeptidase [Candidatus Bipolaricaulota bacterium]